MSRKHFILLAAALRIARKQMDGYGPDVAYVLDEITRTVATVCASCNKEFSFDRFYAAANYKGLNDRDAKRETGNRATG